MVDLEKIQRTIDVSRDFSQVQLVLQ
uniref:Transcriptional regulator n=1 Tax=Heterorhabditis bacteriophora TaxID=37862 RepID=A0A1I7WLY5_HETBA